MDGQVGLSFGSASLPVSFRLYPFYPNPFNPSTIISFDIPMLKSPKSRDNVSLQIYNIQGQWVETLLNKPINPGAYRIQWKPANISSGVYFIQLKVGDELKNQKITFMK